jgi:hypothetical protein
LARFDKISDGASVARALAPLQNFFLPLQLQLFLLVAHTLIQAIILCSRFIPSNPSSEPSSLTIFAPDSTFLPKQIQNHTQTDKNPTPSRWGESIAICHQHCLDSIMATFISSLMDSWLTRLRAVVRKRCTSTWSLSATSILASPPPPVSLPRPVIYASNITLTYITGHLIYKCGGIDKRTIEKFEKVRIPHRCCRCTNFHLIAIFCPSVG